MPYNIKTRDGITLRNIPDDWKPDDPRLKQAVAQRRAQMQQGGAAPAPGDPGYSAYAQQKMNAQNPAEYDQSSPQFQKQFGAAGSEPAPIRANIGAGLGNFTMGVEQLALPKSLEKKFGITDESIDEKRKNDAQLADSQTGGKFLQAFGESLPLMAIPGGGTSRLAGSMIPKLGAMGVGTKVLPSLMAEGGLIGGGAGLLTPSKSDESVVANTLAGTAGGMILPAALKGLGALGRPFIPALRERGVAQKLAGELDVSPAAQTKLQKAISQSGKRVVNAPQSTAALTQNDELARMELAARANKETTAPWSQLDDSANTARWDALDSALGSQATVDTAREATDNFAKLAIPEVMKAMNKSKLAAGVGDLSTATSQMLDKAIAKANPDKADVFQYMAEQIHKSDKSAKALWNIRKTLRDWHDGRPPPGKEGTRGSVSDVAISEGVGAIDEILNRASGKKWSKFLNRYGEFAQKEAQQKAGQNIRNTFMGEVQGQINGAATKNGAPVVTRAKLVQAIKTHGQNKFGDTLDFPQRDVLSQVEKDLRMDEILQRVKSTATGKGGSQTAPLLSLMKASGSNLTGGKFSALASWVGNYGRGKQQQLINQILLEPEDALALMKTAHNIKRPLSNAEKRLVYGARAFLNASPQGLPIAVAKDAAKDESQ